MGGTARGSIKIQGQNISKDQSNKSNPQMHILHLSTSFYLRLSACWNLWVTENNSGKQDSLKVGDVFFRQDMTDTDTYHKPVSQRVGLQTRV